jgi:hypothetical protein
MSYTPTIPAVADTAVIREAEFVKLTVTFTNGTARTTGSFYFSSSYRSENINSANYGEMGALVAIGGQQRSISSTGYDTTVSITGLDPLWIYVVAGGPLATPLPLSNGQPDIPVGYYPIIKGSTLEIRRGFYDVNYNLTSSVLRYTGIITNYSITESRELGFDAVDDNYTINLQSSAIRQVLETRINGRKTNQQSWQYWYPNDTSMNRIAGLEGKQFDFGRAPLADPTAMVSDNNDGGG